MSIATSKLRSRSILAEPEGYRAGNVVSAIVIRSRSSFVLTLILGSFVLVQLFLPLRTAVQIGGDEGFELAKATLCLKGHKLYSEVWNDQPPLHTFIITQVLKYLSGSVLGPRLVTSLFTAMLLASIFIISHRICGLLVATLTATLLIGSPGFLELSSSSMVEIPAVAPAVAALAFLLVVGQTKWRMVEILAGIAFGVALQIKLISAILLPLAAFIFWLQHRKSPCGKIGGSLLVFAGSVAVSFVAIDCFIDGGAYMLHFRQSWAAHFAPATSFEYGSASDHPFDWSILLKNWDTTIPAVFGIIFSLQQKRRAPWIELPVAWMALTLILFASHRPWWSYYYVHIAIPLCWCAAIGIKAVGELIMRRRDIALGVLLGLFGAGALSWTVARVCLQAAAIRHSPQLYSSVFLTQIERLKPFTDFIYGDEPVYSFHAGIPMPPRLAIVSLKRLWSGDLTNAKIVEELCDVKPGIILLANDARVLPFEDLLRTDYTLIYMDQNHRLYGQRSMLAKAKW